MFRKIIGLACLLLLSLNNVSAQYSCTSAIPITGITTFPSAAASTGSNNWVTSANPCGGWGNDYFVNVNVYLYSYTATTTGESFSMTIESTDDDLALTVFSTCAGTALSGCIDEDVNSFSSDNLTVCAENLTAGTEYYIAVSRYHTESDVYSFNINNFIVSPPSPVASDECADAGVMNLTEAFEGNTSCFYTPSTVGTGPCGFQMHNDSWLQFTASSTTVDIDYDVFDCANGDGVQFNVFSGSCGSLSLLAGSCLNGVTSAGTWNLTGLVAGQTYYIRVDGAFSDICNYSFTPSSGVVVIPPNDDCANAQSITCDAAALTGDLLGATATDAPNGCPAEAVEEAGIWFTFTGNGGDYTINTSGSDFSTDLNVYYANSGTPADYCNNLVCETSYTGAAQEATVTISTVNNRVYYIYLDGKLGAIGNYSIAMTCVSCDANAGTWN